MASRIASCITASITTFPYESSVPLEQFKDSQGNLDDVKLIKAFNDAKTPLVFTAKVADSAGCGDSLGFRSGPAHQSR